MLGEGVEQLRAGAGELSGVIVERHVAEVEARIAEPGELPVEDCGDAALRDQAVSDPVVAVDERRLHRRRRVVLEPVVGLGDDRVDDQRHLVLETAPIGGDVGELTAGQDFGHRRLRDGVDGDQALNHVLGQGLAGAPVPLEVLALLPPPDVGGGAGRLRHREERSAEGIVVALLQNLRLGRPYPVLGEQAIGAELLRQITVDEGAGRLHPDHELARPA
jgi:hypothetical protein